MNADGRGFMLEESVKLVVTLMTGTRGWPPDLEKRMWELAAEGVLAWTWEPARLPEPVAVNRGPELLSDLVVGCRICGTGIYCRKSVIAEKQTRG